LATQAFSFSLQVAEWYQSDIKTLISWKRQVIIEKQLKQLPATSCRLPVNNCKTAGERQASAGVS